MTFWCVAGHVNTGILQQTLTEPVRLHMTMHHCVGWMAALLHTHCPQCTAIEKGMLHVDTSVPYIGSALHSETVLNQIKWLNRTNCWVALWLAVDVCMQFGESGKDGYVQLLLALFILTTVHSAAAIAVLLCYSCWTQAASRCSTAYPCRRSLMQLSLLYDL